MAILGIKHEVSGLTTHLDAMKSYMPRIHREFIEWSRGHNVRKYVLGHAKNTGLKGIYNDCLNALLSFRKLHVEIVKIYIFQHSGNPDQLGTGGTVYLDWLQRLADETDMHLL